jgi:glycerol uptake facilitator-like aquaporin
LGTAILAGVIPLALGFHKSELTPVIAGFVLTAVIYSLGPKSGAHVNPALTITLWLASPKSMHVKDVLGYIVSQCAGAVVGAFLIAVSINNKQEQQNGAFHFAFTNNKENGIDLFHACVVEFVAVGIFFWLIIQLAADTSNSYWAMAIGFAMSPIVLVTSGLSGGCLNPALALGQNLVADTYGTNPPFYGSLTGTRTTSYAVAEILGGMFSLVLLYFTTAPPPAKASDKAAPTSRAERRASLLEDLHAGIGGDTGKETSAGGQFGRRMSLFQPVLSINDEGDETEPLLSNSRA